MMKYIVSRITIASMLIFLLFTACDENELIEDPKDLFAPENLYTNTAGFESALNGAYAWVRREGLLNTHIPSMHVGTDLTWSNNSTGVILPFEQYGAGLTPSNDAVSNWYTLGYQGIALTNLIIDQAQKPDVDWNSPDDAARITAEARFIRAHWHNILTTIFGDVPIADKFYTEPKLDFVRTPKQQVLEFVRDDLIFAAANLPADPGSLPRGKVTRWAALHLLSEVYLHLGQHEPAESAAQEVINNGPHQLMTERFGPEAGDPEGNVFHDLFLEGNVDFKDGNLETLWVVQQEYGAIGGNNVGGGWGDWRRRKFMPAYEVIPGLQLADSLGGRGIARCAPTQAYLDLYTDSEDIRNFNNNIKRKWYYNDPNDLPAGKQLGDLIVLDPNDPMYEDFMTINLYPATQKWNFGAIGRGGSATYLGMDKDYAISRLGETYLLLAEAQHLQGKNTEAAATLTTLRARSNASPVVAGDVDMNFILDERARELYSEVRRRQTLARTGMFVERVKAMNPQAAVRVEEKDALFPIPQSVIDGNPDADFPQNPGY